MLVAHDQELQPAISRLEHAAGHGAPDLLALEVDHHHPDHLDGARGLQQADLDATSLGLVATCIERGRQRLEGVQRGRHVDRHEGHAVGNAVLALVVDHQAGEGLQHRVHRRPSRQRPGLAEAGHRQIENARLALRYGLVAETEPVEHAGTVALQQHVGTGDQAPQHLLARIRLQIERDRPLAEVGRDRIGGVAAVAPAQRPRPVALSRRLDLDDVGAVLGQQHAAVGSGHPLAQIDDLEPRKRRVVAHRCFPRCSVKAAAPVRHTIVLSCRQRHPRYRSCRLAKNTLPVKILYRFRLDGGRA